MTALLIAIASVFGALVLYSIGYIRGYRHGRELTMNTLRMALNESATQVLAMRHLGEASKRKDLPS